MSDYDKSLNELVKRLNYSLEIIQKQSEHITPTINDFYDLFLTLKLKIRTENNTELIIKALKSFVNHKISKDGLMKCIIENVILPSISNNKLH